MTINNQNAHPLQSSEWGEFRKKWGNDVVRTSFGQTIFSIIPHSKFTNGTFIKGPKPTKEILQGLKNLAKEKKAIFIKMESLVVTKVQHNSQIPNHETQINSKFQITKLLQENGAVPGKTLFTPTTFWIDLTPSEDELLKSFSSKTRYNIRVAEKHGVKVVENNSDKAFDKYIELTRQTVERQGFYAHSEKYHRLMWKYLYKIPISKSQIPIARLLTAKYKGEIITTWIVFVWHDFLYYPYGASSDKYKNVMANNLMMWEAIKYGKKLGLSTFDLWGWEPGKGFTKFKEGYSPRVVEFLGTWDLQTSPFYWPYRGLEFIRWNFLKTKGKFIKPTF